MRAITDSGAAVVVATHDPAVIDAADQVVRLDHGRRVA
jgi:ABC-type lipoprotein export system ATPase subunit